jgi:hypothetical protein
VDGSASSRMVSSGPFHFPLAELEEPSDGSRPFKALSKTGKYMSIFVQV